MKGAIALSVNFDLEYKPKLDHKTDYGIATVGAGGIIQASHLPAYRKAGFNVVGTFDLDINKAEALAKEFGIPKVYRSLDELLADPEVAIVDIAVPAKAQPGIVAQAAAAGKHVLCQKPLAETYPEGLAIVKSVEEAGVKGAVNQNLRYDAAIQASKTIMDRGWLGEPVLAEIQVNVWTPWQLWPWMLTIDRLEVMYHSIHYLDTIRYLFGTPKRVYARGLRHPNQEAKAETRTTAILEYDSDFQGLVYTNHNNWEDDMSDWRADYRFEGTDGVVKGTLGALHNYPIGEPDTLQFRTAKLDRTYWFRPKLEEKWFPDAFVGTMAELMRSIDTGEEAENSVQDNLETLQLIFAAYRSMEEGRPVALAEIAAGGG